MANRYKVLDEVGGNDDIGDRQRRKQDLAERTDVDHPRGMVEALQRCYGFAVVAILAVIVVLDNPGSRALGPLKQLKTTGSAHRRSEWILVRWRNVSGTRLATPLDAKSYIQPILINGNSYQTASRPTAHVPRYPPSS